MGEMELGYYSDEVVIKSVVFDQTCFDFIQQLERATEFEPIQVLERVPFPLEEKCRNIMCSKRSAEGKAYCSKAHSPFAHLTDEPDNAPIDGWTPPEGFYTWNTHALKLYRKHG